MKLAILPAAALVLVSTVAFSASANGGHGPMARVDASEDGKITQAESRTAAAAFFQKLDSDGNGVITQAEADTARARRGDKGKEHAQARFSEKDANKNGKLERSEVSRMPDGKFKALDTNKDGALTQEEMMAGWAAKHGDRKAQREGGGKREGHDPFTQADSNKDGQVTKIEAQAQADARFKKADKNGDGVLSGDELRHGRHGGKSACGPKKDGKTSAV